MGTNYYVVRKKPTVSSPLHIGKSSMGWRFLFHEVNKGECEFNNDLEIHTYEQWEKYLSDNEDIVILNEYDEEVETEDFLAMVKSKQTIENQEDFTYCKNVNGYRFSDGEFS